MSETENMPSADRDIDFCEKAINSGYIVKEIVPSILRKLNEKRISGVQSSIGQELIALDLMTPEQVKEILLMLENIELTCENCGKKYIIRAYDPGRQYACKECGAYLEPADADLRILKQEQSQMNGDNRAARTTSSGIGDPNPQLADLLPPEESENNDETDDPILASAREGSLKGQGVIGKNVFSLDDEMLNEVQNEKENELNRILGIDAKSVKKKPGERPSLARERKLAAQKKQDEELGRRGLDVGKRFQEHELASDEIEINAGHGEKPGSLNSPVNVKDFVSKYRDDVDSNAEASNDKLMKQSEFMKMIDPEVKDKDKDAEDKVDDSKESLKEDKKEKKKKEKKVERSERALQKFQRPFSKTGHEKKGISVVTILLVILLFAAMVGDVMMYLLWSNAKNEYSNLKIQLSTAKNTAKQLQAELFKVAEANTNQNWSESEKKGQLIVRGYEDDYSRNPTPENARKIGELIKTKVVVLHPVFALNSAEFYQKGGAAREAMILLRETLDGKGIDTHIKVRIILKIAEILVFDLSESDVKSAQDFIAEAKNLKDISEKHKQLLSVWSNVLSGKHHSVLKFVSKDSYENNLAFLLDKFARLIPSLRGKFRRFKLTEEMKITLEKALLLYEDNYSIELIGCLNVNASGNARKTVENFNAFQKKFGFSVFTQELLSQMYISLESFTDAEKVLSWLINQKKDLTEGEKRRDKVYLEHLAKRADAFVKTSKYKNAITDLTSLIRLFPTDSYKFRIKLGNVYMLLGKYDEASVQFEIAYEYDKGVEVKKLLIKAYIELQNFLPARELLEELKDDPSCQDDCEINVLQGLFYLRKTPRDVDSALNEFNQALEKDKTCIDALYHKALVELERNYYDSAKVLIDKISEIDSMLWQYYFLKALYSLKKKPSDADGYFKLALKTAPRAKHAEIESYIK